MGASTDWTLIWQDEFEGETGSSPDPTQWTHEIGGKGWGNNEWQYYTARPENAALDGNSSLVITAREENPADYECWNGRCRYTSARLVTRDKFEFTYGKVEARIKLPVGQGIWPAFWMLGQNFPTVGWPQCGEIDIMEYLGHQPRTVYGTIHGPGYSAGRGIGQELVTAHDLTSDFHVFGLEWAPDSLRWYFDGEPYHYVTPESLQGKQWVYDHPHFILLNLAVGGYWPGYPDETTVFPQTLTVDWVRVYQQQ